MTLLYGRIKAPAAGDGRRLARPASSMKLRRQIEGERENAGAISRQAQGVMASSSGGNRTSAYQVATSSPSSEIF